MSVLRIEDDGRGIQAGRASRGLGMLGMRERAATYAEARSRLREERWQLVLLDLNLPGYGGLDLLEEVQRLWPQLPMIVVSAYAEEEFALRCLRLGAQGYVTVASRRMTSTRVA